jgi:hypothetical protein
MSEFDFLKKMYRRLAEHEHFLNEAKRENPKRKDLVQESAVCAISCSIKDFLDYRKGELK